MVFLFVFISYDKISKVSKCLPSFNCYSLRVKIHSSTSNNFFTVNETFLYFYLKKRYFQKIANYKDTEYVTFITHVFQTFLSKFQASFYSACFDKELPSLV